MKKFLWVKILFLLLLGACAKPEVINIVKTGDNELNCKQLADGIIESQEFKKKAELIKGETGKNYLRAALFWPALLQSYSNINDAIVAANRRTIHLVNIMQNKNCENTNKMLNRVTTRFSRVKDIAGQLEKLHKLYNSGALTEKEYKKAKRKVLIQ